METAALLAGTEPDRLPLSAFDFELPAHLIAQEPAPERTGARLLEWSRASGQLVHSHVAELPRFVRRGDVFVFNDTRVMPARLYGRTATGAAVELLVIRRNDNGNWQGLGRPGRRLRPGVRVRFDDSASATVTASHGNGRYDLAFDPDDVPALLAARGELPLPPYIKRPDGPLPYDRERYQTVFAAHSGAVAAPTAGLHFTPALLDALTDAGAEVAFLTLHVGPGTFLPVRASDLNLHLMEAEWCDVPPATAALVNRARAEGRRVVAVGTTVTRALESAADAAGTVRAGARWAEQFIRPGHNFRVIAALFTNFHLPGSTLLALVCAFAGHAATLAVYADAVRRGYRFYSYGDAMLIE
ncbi:MAG: tRNA preQ1(34) S-adenosylmethionine ribosyltransferase-isomerase QueA [Deltaproteobacteria bacterium]|nr:tRNA preQ1(34) S-adenosylmethionine ribosyltransferase-isomerase QueA [Deltaproteobacteria bacterium]